MKEFLIQNWVSIAITIALTVYLWSLVAAKRFGEIRSIAYRLILHAEKTIRGTKRGKDRFKYVLNSLYEVIPAWVRFFYSRTDMELQLQGWFEELKDYLDDGKINKSTGGNGNA